MDFLAEIGPGSQLGPYTLIRKLGEGGMGVVYEARHERLRRPAAVKVLCDWLSTGLGRKRFEREVQACAQLTHPNAVEIYDYGETKDGTLYYAMEYLDGYDLKQLVEFDGPQSAPRTIRILRAIAGALDDAHAHGLVHRDIKPPNILLCEAGGVPDIAKLVDFGLVVPVGKKGRLTVEGHALGTPRYVAPEMLRPRATVSGAADFYALGLVAYYLLSGRHAFDGIESQDILRRQRDEMPAPLEQVAPSVSADLAKVVHWCLQKEPDQRPDGPTLSAALAGCADAERWDEEAARAWWDQWRPNSLRPPELVPSDAPGGGRKSDRPSLTDPEPPMAAAAAQGSGGEDTDGDRPSLTNPERPRAKAKRDSSEA